MNKSASRLIFVVVQHSGGWAVEHEGAFTDLSRSREEAMASASRRARAANEAGAPSQVVIQGESGYFTAAR